MVGVERRGLSNNNTASDLCPERQVYKNITNGDDHHPVLHEGEFDWDKRQQGLLMGSYYWSYTAFQIPAAWLATKYGFRLVFGISTMMSGIITLLFPICARGHVYLALAARVLIGLFHAVAFPAMTGAWGAWAPPMEITQ